LSKGEAKTAVEVARRVRRVVALEKIILTASVDVGGSNGSVEMRYVESFGF
jgi:hypothetical protein